MEKITIDLIERFKGNLENLVHEMQSEFAHCQYIDLRMEVGEGQGTIAENGIVKGSGRDYAFSYGVRVIAGREMSAPGYFGQSLGTADVENLLKIVREGIIKAYQRAITNAEFKSQRKAKWGVLGNSLWSTKLAEIKLCRDVISPVCKVNPLDVPLEEVARLAKEVSQMIGASDPKVKFNQVIAETHLNRELFVSSEGANIDRTYALTQGLTFVVAVGSQGVNQTHYDAIGHLRGFEVLTDGVNEEFTKLKPLRDFSLDLAKDAAELSECEACPTSEGEVVVITDPHFNTLKVHEIIGHPSELDRGLKMETAYAGRTWLLRNLKENMVGKQVASSLVSAFSDPTLSGYGHYEYDDEGTPAKRVVHIDQGIFTGFMNSRQTAAIFGGEPNGHYKATEASLVPLIRMSNTIFAPGNRKPEDIIREVQHGYYLVGHRIPSISESRENFRITARKVFEIKNGEIVAMFRDGGIMANTRDYFMSVDAVGNDLRLYPIFNCGKGQPMQAKQLGNGGPTMRARARLVGAGQ